MRRETRRRARATRHCAWLALVCVLCGLAAEARADAFDEGLDHLEAGRYGAAIDSFERLATDHPDSAIPSFYAGIAASMDGADEQAVRFFARAAELEPDYPEVQLRLGVTLYHVGDLDGAERHLLSALVQGPETGELLYFLGLVDLERGETDRAIRLFGDAASLDPSLGPTAAEEIALAQAAGRDAAGLSGPPSLRRFAATAGAGIEWDDELVIPETELATGIQDYAGVFDLSFDTFPVRLPRAELAVGYDFFQSLYSDTSELDVQSHSPRIDAYLVWRNLTPRIGYQFSRERLGTDPYLSAHRLTGGLETRVTSIWFVDLALDFEALDFDSLSDLDALRWTFGLGQRLDLLDGRLSLYLAWKPEWQDAKEDRLDYLAHRLEAGGSAFLERPGRGIDLRFGYRFEVRNFDELAPGVGQVRADVQHRLRLGATVPLVWHTEAMLDYVFVSSRSGLDVLDYTENVVTFRIGVWL